MADTVVLFMGDHGTHFADNPWQIMGNPHPAMWPGVMHLPLIVRWPGTTPGRTVDDLVYNVDATATVYDAGSVEGHETIHGRSLRPLLTGAGPWERRPYVTCRFDDSLCCIDDAFWVRTNVRREPGELFDLRKDPECHEPLGWSEHPAVVQRAWERLIADAGGSLPVYDPKTFVRTDAVGEEVVARETE